MTRLSKLAGASLLALTLAACGGETETTGRVELVAHTSNQNESGTHQADATNWVISASVGLDALLLIGAAAGDEMQAGIYGEDIARLRSGLSERGNAVLDQMGQHARADGRLLGPNLVLLFSGADFSSLDAVLTAARDPEGILRPPYEASDYWDEDAWPNIIAAMPGLVLVLEEMQANGFEADWTDRFGADIDASIARIDAAVSPYDIIPEQSRLLGRTLDPRIDLVVVHYSQPYGIRVQGQRFLAHHSYDAETQLRIAAHEIFHPPFARNDAALEILLADLRADPWVISIVEDHDPQFGYNSFNGVINEDSTQALDQIVSERLGFARDPGERWRHADGGMHMIAAALYQAMIEDGFAEAGGSYSDWLKSALERGLLTPDEVRRRAALIVGEDAVNAWGPDREAN